MSDILEKKKQACIDMSIAYASTIENKEIDMIKMVGPLIHYVYKKDNEPFMENIITDTAKECEKALLEAGYKTINPICGIKFKK